ncbi:Copper/zinc superoxide dismutase (SODC) [uncultured virus]|nr:Copper/zinc superoxide dismutase (SODC) [uncultured virus]
MSGLISSALCLGGSILTIGLLSLAGWSFDNSKTCGQNQPKMNSGSGSTMLDTATPTAKENSPLFGGHFNENAIATISSNFDSISAKYRNKISGVIMFKELKMSSAPGQNSVLVSGKISGLNPNQAHAMHVHESGDLSHGCHGVGHHFNPTQKEHGARVRLNSDGKIINNLDRHVGDLGNIKADQNGVAEFSFIDEVIGLNGSPSILNKAIVIHENTDDEGKTSGLSKIDGNSGDKIACGVILPFKK